MPSRFFSIKSPCGNCPFIKNQDASIVLRKGRREEIMREVLSGENPAFHCHKTVYENTNGPKRVCAGAASLAKKMGGNMMMVQLAERMGVIKTDHYEGANKDVLDTLNIDHCSQEQLGDSLLNSLKLNTF